MTKDEALKRLAESRQALLQAIQGLSEQELTQSPVEGVWTIKDLVGHIASWDVTCLDPLRGCMDGALFQAEVLSDHLAWNDVQSARKKDLPWDAVLREAEAVRQEMVAAASRLSDEQLAQRATAPWGDEGAVVEMLAGLAGHERMHVRAIRQWREGHASKE